MSAARKERLEFSNTRGQLLAARMHWPAGTPRAYLLFAHCFTCSQDLDVGGRDSISDAEADV